MNKIRSYIPVITYRKILMAIFSLCFIISLLGILAIYQVRSQIEHPSPTVLYDQSGQPINPNSSKLLTIDKVPTLTLKYIENGREYLKIPELLFSDQPLKKFVGNLLVTHFYNEEQLKGYYLNNLYFHPGLLGVENASQYFFHKGIEKITPLENIFLLSKIENRHQDTEENFKAFVLGLYKHKLITKDEQIQYIKEFPALLKQQNTFAMSYMDYSIYEIQQKFKMHEEEFFRNGYSVNTSMDRKIQVSLLKTFQQANVLTNNKINQNVEAGMAIVNHKSGEIPGLIGGINEQNSTLNRAYQITRQPASTFKPLIVFGPALDVGWKPSDLLEDTPMTFGNFRPVNFDHQFRGTVTVKDAITQSYNVPAVWLLNRIGLDTGLNYIDKFGLFPIDRRDGLQLALGFTRVGTSPLAMAQAYTVFPHSGKMVEAHAIKNIKNRYGITVYRGKGNETKIFNESTAKTMTKLLTNVVENGSGVKAKIPNQTIAGKTGTTSYDAWFVGFNDNYVGAVWMGPDEVIPKNRMSIDGGDTPSVLFKKVFSTLK